VELWNWKEIRNAVLQRTRVLIRLTLDFHIKLQNCFCCCNTKNAEKGIFL